MCHNTDVWPVQLSQRPASPQSVRSSSPVLRHVLQDSEDSIRKMASQSEPVRPGFEDADIAIKRGQEFFRLNHLKQLHRGRFARLPCACFVELLLMDCHIALLALLGQLSPFLN